MARNDLRKGRRTNRQDEADRTETDAAATVERATRVARPQGSGRKSKAYDAAKLTTDANLTTAAKIGTSELVAIDDAEHRYAEALKSYEALLLAPPPSDKAGKAEHAAKLKAAETVYELRRRALYDTRHTANTRSNVAMLLVKAAKVGHDARVGDKVGRVGVKGIEQAARSMLGDGKAPLAH